MANPDLESSSRGALVAALRQLIAEMELWATDPTAAVDQAAEQFYRETGYMAPGKSVPLEMAATQHDDERQRRYTEWHLQRRALRHNTIRQAADRLASLDEPQETQLQAALRQLAEVWLAHADDWRYRGQRTREKAGHEVLANCAYSLRDCLEAAAVASLDETPGLAEIREALSVSADADVATMCRVISELRFELSGPPQAPCNAPGCNGECSQTADMEAEHARQCQAAYDAGVNDGHEQGFEEGKRWEP